MEIIETFFKLGFKHILDFESYDHILFLICLCAAQPISEWKRLFILITGFTLGHSLSLALSINGVISLPSDLTEWLIALTIFITAFGNLFRSGKSERWLVNINYIVTTCFGLIHGMAFSNQLRQMLFEALGIWKPLLGFNLGVEAGQMLFILIFFMMIAFLTQAFKTKQRDITLVLSGAGLGVSLLLLFQRFPF